MKQRKGKEKRTFTFGNNTDVHEVDNKDCSECWRDYPKKCTCGGLVHAEFGDEDSDGNYWLHFCCDRCGEDYEEAE